MKAPGRAGSRGAATRARLLQAAETEFGEKGFHAASVSSITRLATVSQGTFYIYFSSKDEIFSTLVGDIGHALRKHMALAVTGSPSRIAAERAGLEAFLDFTQHHRGLYRIIQESQFVDPAAHRDYYQRVAEGYSKGIAQATRRGELTAGNAEARAWAIMGIGHFLGLRYCLWQGQAPSRQVMDDVIDLIANGMARGRTGASA
ncbi:MAG TPA: TetR/AcrR family transcriptional regulator [Solimonas sp.]|nr:TetR/AcrR family transcriptional regulator [Solimonas sp.]